ncbi:MAG: hypothetical protein ACR2PL_18645 [Dehalococcoidia bacterium]
MPTYALTDRFKREYAKLTPEQKAAFKVAVQRLVADLKAGRGFRNSRRIKRVRVVEGVYEMTWAPDGRATFEFGASIRADQVHVIWRRCGTHDILAAP